jgi:DNA end-binding protein Ku
MARAIWSGAISFGLVSVPVKAYTAVRDHKVHFHQLQKGTTTRVRNKKVSEKTGRELDADHIELGYELSSGRYVTVDPDELDELRPHTTRSIDISDFVALDEIDPIYYERTYWLAPTEPDDDRAYRLLLAAMEAEQRVGIGSVVMRRKQYLAAIRPLDGALAMSTMRFADEVVAKSDLDALPSRRRKPDAKELKMATSIIDALNSDWNPKRYHDTYTDELRQLIEQRAEGNDVEVDPGEATDAQVVDLMEALEASVAAAKTGRGKTGRAKRSGSGTRSRGRARKSA